MKVAHVRESHGPAGAPWRLAVSLDRAETPSRWLDLEVARRRLIALDPRRAHNAVLYRQPLTTLDDTLARGIRIGAYYHDRYVKHVATWTFQSIGYTHIFHEE